MLHILAVILILLLLNPVSVRAGFFEEETAPMQETECSSCASRAVNLNPDLKNKVATIEKAAFDNFNKKESTYGNQIILFVDLINSSSDVAVNALVKFKKDNPSWKVRGVIIANRENLKAKLLQKQQFFNNGIKFSINLSGSLTKESGIFKTPAYLITFNGKHHRITGLADLNDAISKLDK
ncbi:MAG: hypothetical protein WC417_08040 [Candidatus Omnitrophota bacterium]